MRRGLEYEKAPTFYFLSIKTCVIVEGVSSLVARVVTCLDFSKWLVEYGAYVKKVTIRAIFQATTTTMTDIESAITSHDESIKGFNLRSTTTMAIVGNQEP